MKKNITVYLNTPLIQTVLKDYSLLIDRVRGSFIEESNLGMLLDVSHVGNAKEWNAKSPFKKILIPAHKIDFVDYGE